MKALVSLLLLALLIMLPGCMVGRTGIKADVEPVTNSCPSLSQVKLAYRAETPPLKVALERVLIERCQVKDLVSLQEDAGTNATNRPTILVSYSPGPSSVWEELSGVVSGFSFAIIPGFSRRVDRVEIVLKGNQGEIARDGYKVTRSSVSWLPLALFQPDFWFFLMSGAYLDEQKRVKAYEEVFTHFMADAGPRLIEADGGGNQ